MNELHERSVDGQVNESSGVARRRRRDASQWGALIDQHRDSGLSIRAFCGQRGLSEASFHAWRRRLRDQSLPTPDGSAQFVRLQPRAGREDGVVEVRFACGATLRCSADHLAELVGLLKGAGESGAC